MRRAASAPLLESPFDVLCSGDIGVHCAVQEIKPVLPTEKATPSGAPGPSQTDLSPFTFDKEILQQMQQILKGYPDGDDERGKQETGKGRETLEDDEWEDRKIHQSWSTSSDDRESDKDYTACSASDCGYCGHCSY